MMKKLALLMVLLGGLALMAACGSGGSEDGTTAAPKETGTEGEAPPTGRSTRVDTDGIADDGVVEATPAATTVPTPEPTGSGVGEQLKEMVLEEEDVPGGLDAVGAMGMDFDFDFLPEASIGGGTTYMSIFADELSQDMIVSMVIYMEDGDEVSQALIEMEELSINEIQDAFSMMGGFFEIELVDVREIDVSGLGDGGFGMGMTVEMGELGRMDAEYAFWGDGPVMAMVMTMNMGGGSAADVVPLAETMAEKIEAVLG